MTPRPWKDVRADSGRPPGRVERAAGPAPEPGVSRAARAYLAAALLLAVLLGIQTTYHRWGGDVWEHAAVVRALAEDPGGPAHPVLPGDAPHAFAVPSALLAATIVLATGAGPFDALALIAALNLGLLLAGIWSFTRAVPHREPWVPFVALGFSLFLWGPNPWGYSGFLHLNQIGQSLPYPSTFAFGVALLALAAYAGWIERGRARRLVASLALAPLVILSHPVASIFLCTMTAALLVRNWSERSAWAGAALMGLVSLVAALAWPYYPFPDLVGASAAFDASNRVLYRGTLLRTLPLLPGLAVVVGRLRRCPRDPLSLAILGLLGVYAAGFVFDRWSLGRVMSPLAFLLQVALADWTVARRRTLRSAFRAPGLRGVRNRAAVAGVAFLCLGNMAPGLARTVPPALLPGGLAADDRLAPVDHRHRFLEGVLDSGDVVLASPETGWPVPAYGGKILAPAHPQAFVETSGMRADVETFFAEGTSRPERRAIGRRYGAEWILVDRRDPRSARLLPELRQLAGRAVEHEGLCLLSFRESGP